VTSSTARGGICRPASSKPTPGHPTPICVRLHPPRAIERSRIAWSGETRAHCNVCDAGSRPTSQPQLDRLDRLGGLDGLGRLGRLDGSVRLARLVLYTLGMTAKSYPELICWQLSVQLRDEMIDVTDRPRVARNFKFCEQVGDSTRSTPSNIAEGFGRSNREFRRYLDIALGSLQETENHVDEALRRKYVSNEEHQHFRRLTKRAHKAALRLSQYLQGCIRQRAKPRRQPVQPDQPVKPAKPPQ
jgi:four helix bundle protein